MSQQTFEPAAARVFATHWVQKYAALAALSIVQALTGCSSISDSAGALSSFTVQEPDDPKYLPSSEPYRLGAGHFARGQYGLAERYFRDAAEKAPSDAAAWVALASSYDRLRRFDLADDAYRHAIALTGETVQILNNQGYSHLLRGNLKSARTKFLKAAALEPENPTIQNNLKLLEGGAPLIQTKS